jgi:hypothetical protein
MLRNTLPLVCLACLLCGCGESGKPSGTISGLVTMNGQPVTVGEVNLFSVDNGAGAKAALDDAGKFAVDDPIDAGTYKVYITPPTITATGGADGSPPPPAAMLTIPPKYTSLETTDLTVEIKPGTHETRPLELK